ncbi:uncharacterized protein TRUGW13939_05038 [Talaromyces rugulosus]|uniref:RNA polymerase III RPC4-domain-containing protein n=1 Tax=Talaromyces rugulosus TaxID=121627 RepID=A0A7H8QW77_TALRU|nr:uncharacterized protein TRUGW13939_05038 [Talaromyces rugulosus]QKX57918.1 hypothetical protein TRUGW13939_05038 [Talaromyces rugulosus]
MPPKANPSAPRAGNQPQASREQGNSTTPSASSPPGRPPVQRLQSLTKRTTGPSLSNRAAIGLDDPDKPKPALKFKPRAPIRRTKEERDAILKIEEERNRQRLEEASAIQRSRLGPVKKPRGAFRGRGGTFGGPSMRGGPMRGRGGRFDMDSRASSISRHSMPAWGGGDEGPYYSSDEETGGIRTSIDQINLDRDGDDEDEVDKKGKKAVRSSRPTYRGPLPIRVIRHEHEERVVGVNTEASSSTSAELRREAKEKDQQGDTDGGLFVPQDTEEQKGPAVKPEPAEEDVSMSDLPPAHVDDDDENPLPEQTTKARKTVTIKDPRSLLRTREEIEEFSRHNEDLEMMREILTLEEAERTPAKPSETADTETDGASEPKEETEDEKLADEKNAGKLFLIQFPPLTPNLVIPGEEGTDNQNDTNDDVMITHSNTRTDQPKVKVENEDADSKDHIKQPSKLVTAVEKQLPAGRVGRLNLHKSGKVTLDWGGISFELDKGADVNFNQEALIASTPATGATADELEEKQVWAMGELSGKFIASPEWNRLL